MAEGMTLEEQGEAGRAFVAGLLGEFGMQGAVETRLLDEDTVEIAALGEDLGILVGPRGSTLTALQDVTRAVVQRQCPSRTDRILVDVAGYRERRCGGAHAVQRPDRRGGPGVGTGEGPRADESGRPQDRPRRHQWAVRGRDPLGGRGPQPPHRHRAGGLTRRRCPAPTKGATPPLCSINSSARRVPLASWARDRSSPNSSTPKASAPLRAAWRPLDPSALVDLGSGAGPARAGGGRRLARGLRGAARGQRSPGRFPTPCGGPSRTCPPGEVLEERAEVCGRQEGLQRRIRRGPGPILRTPRRGGRVRGTTAPSRGLAGRLRTSPVGRRD